MTDPVKQVSVVESQRLGVSTSTISISAFLAFLVAYSHFFGMSYRKSYLEGLGFESMNIKISPDESIYFAVTGFESLINQVITFDFFSFKASYLMAGVSFSLIIIANWAVKKFNNRSEIQPVKQKKEDSFYLFIDRMTDSFFKSIGLSLISFFASYILQVVITLVIAVSFSALWLLMALGMLAGYNDGEKLMNKPICNEFDWDDKKKDRILGCRELQLKNGELIKGIYIHKDNNANYFLSNKGAFEINTKNEMISFRPINNRPDVSNEK